jgi:hypothetical protein
MENEKNIEYPVALRPNSSLEPLDDELTDKKKVETAQILTEEEEELYGVGDPKKQEAELNNKRIKKAQKFMDKEDRIVDIEA